MPPSWSYMLSGVAVAVLLHMCLVSAQDYVVNNVAVNNVATTNSAKTTTITTTANAVQNTTAKAVNATITNTVKNTAANTVSANTVKNTTTNAVKSTTTNTVNTTTNTVRSPQLDAARSLPKTPAPSPAAVKVFPLKQVTSQPPLCKSKVAKFSQCGGTGGDCKKYPYDLKPCNDAPWSNACCEKGYSCQRVNSGWWQCTAIPKNGPVPPTILPSQLPRNATLKPITIDSLDKKHRYLLIKYDTTWDIASAICQYYFGLQLASVHDVGEMWRINNQCHVKMENMCWVGAHDRPDRGIFKWSDGSSWDWSFFQQYGGAMKSATDRCIALQDGFQTWPCDTPLSIACKVY